MRQTMAACVLVALLAIAGTAAAQTGQRFDDVPTDAYYHDAVNWAVDAGITTGCGDGTNFCPDRTLTRAETVTFLHRYHQYLRGETDAPEAQAGIVSAREFSDAKASLDAAWRAQNPGQLQAAWERLYELRSGADPDVWAALVERCEELRSRGWMRWCTDDG